MEKSPQILLRVFQSVLSAVNERADKKVEYDAKSRRVLVALK
jgi:hypothetical protein